MSNELAAFDAFCAERNVRLMPHQREFARLFFTVDEKVAEGGFSKFMRDGRGAGRTFVFEMLEAFYTDGH